MTRRLIAAAGLTSTLLIAGCAQYAGGLTKPPLNTIYRVALVRYDCGEGGREQIKVSYPSHGRAVVVYHGKSYPMDIARSADGARYTGEHLEWWIKGSGSGSKAALFAHRADGTTGDIIERCIQTSLAQ